jgi:hypothetical protein
MHLTEERNENPGRESPDVLSVQLLVQSILVLLRAADNQAFGHLCTLEIYAHIQC